MSAARLKILMVGPSKAGKSSLSSFLAGIQDSVTPAAAPAPTMGVRVLELERHGAAVELWDVSGDQQYESTWPAVLDGAGGVVLVYDPEAEGQAVRGVVGPRECARAARVHSDAPLEGSPTARAHNDAHTSRTHQQRETELWYSWFVAKPNFDASRVACWALSSSGAAGQTVPPGAIGGVQTETFLLRADSGEGVRRAWDRLLERLLRR
jgi:hypothetical protein